jgi:hypothetical protein
MVRRSGVASRDGVAQSAAYADGSPLGFDTDQSVQDKSPWSGGGGRWMVWPMRVLLWAALLVVAYRGVTAIVLDEVPARDTGVSSGSTSSLTQFPVTLAEAFALQFGQVYLNFSPASAGARAQQLAQFIPSNASSSDPNFGWNGSGTLRLQSAQVAGIDVRDANHAVVTLLATVNGQMMELGVPVYAAGAGIVVSAQPAWLPAPPVAVPAGQQQGSSDPAAQSALANQLPAFFQAYASGDSATLNRFLAQGVTLNGLGGTVTYGSIASIYVPAGGATRDITVTVNWQLAGQAGAGGAQLATTYDMSVVDQQSGKWYVRGIRASTQPMGNQ